MKFEHDYITPDGAFQVQVDMNNLTYDTRPSEKNWTAKNITYNTVYVYNTRTYAVSNKSLYLNKQGRLFFKGKPKGWMGDTVNYFIDELIKEK
ncbi:MAG: hypothetical protein ACI4PF_03805 [Christensenellales bacterium]